MKTSSSNILNKTDAIPLQRQHRADIEDNIFVFMETSPKPGTLIRSIRRARSTPHLFLHCLYLNIIYTLNFLRTALSESPRVIHKIRLEMTDNSLRLIRFLEIFYLLFRQFHFHSLNDLMKIIHARSPHNRSRNDYTTQHQNQ